MINVCGIKVRGNMMFGWRGGVRGGVLHFFLIRLSYYVYFQNIVQSVIYLYFKILVPGLCATSVKDGFTLSVLE